MPESRTRVAYLEGLRGIAALQVVLLHFVTAFLSGAVERDPTRYHGAWEAAIAGTPQRVAYDGHTAVYVFFLISGAVLTPSFARPGGTLAKLAKRLVRLIVPVAAAAAIACALLAAFPTAHARAASLSGSPWFAMDSSGAATLGHLAREVGIDSLLLGYQEATLFGPLAGWLTPMAQSLDAPFWSLHLELYGSALVLALVMLRARSARLHLGAVVVCGVLFGSHPMFLFILGHLSAPLLGRRPGGAAAVAGALLLGLGVAMAADKDWTVVELARLLLDWIGLAGTPSLFQFQSQLAAVAMYGGVLLCGPVWAVLASRPFRLLGRLSFSLYLLHFPLLFTVVALGFLWFVSWLPYGGAVLASLVIYLAISLLAAVAFERWVDRPAIALSRRLTPPASAAARAGVTAGIG
jgi:peptidoglycan/LPS O-acetylase OafA/YrhL